MTKLQMWQMKQKCKELGRKCDETEYGDENFMELEALFIEYFDVKEYLEQKFNGVDLIKNGCPCCNYSSDTLQIGALYKNLSDENKKLFAKFLRFIEEKNSL